MKKLYLITGGTGHLGTELLKQLSEKDEDFDIRLLILPGDEADLPEYVETYEGDVSDKDSMADFFYIEDYDEVTLIHNAAVITIASKEEPLLEKVNVQGVQNICELALENGVDRMIHVSSVHALPENGKDGLITEVDEFDPEAVVGQYAKSKAKGSQIVMDFAQQHGLKASIVHPSGIIGIGDPKSKSYMTQTITGLAQNKFPASIEGGYDFVNVKDVAAGILACEAHGRAGEAYILSGDYVTIREMAEIITDILNHPQPKLNVPLSVLKGMAPAIEKMIEWSGKTPTFTPYSMYTLGSNANFSNQKAQEELGFESRPLRETILEILAEHGYLDDKKSIVE